MTPLRRRMIEDMRVRNLAANTQRLYVSYVSAFARHFGRSPELLGPEEIRARQLHLVDAQRSRSTLVLATAALRFLYTVTLNRGYVHAAIPLYLVSYLSDFRILIVSPGSSHNVNDEKPVQTAEHEKRCTDNGYVPYENRKRRNARDNSKTERGTAVCARLTLLNHGNRAVKKKMRTECRE
ncbi:site-specific integrase [Paraburkholderia nodosa]|uniref:site-specific integrase n=1 Tax=Paraburkholderia nodosa TaxID=392320 RepID=UPI0004B85CA5|nr:site-specific integrase [Paraburkholderia nodosa]